jgi:pimeloyl-ACP methyl ester carboxylesterase
LAKPVVIGHSMGGIVTVELARRFPDLPAALVLLDAPIVRPPAQGAARQALVETLHGPGYRDAVREWVCNAYFLSTDDSEMRDRTADAMASAPQHVLVSSLEQMLRWDGTAAAPAGRVPVLCVSADRPLNDLPRLQELCPHWIYGQTVGAGHFHQLLVPEQVNAMIERFLAVYAPQPVGA